MAARKKMSNEVDKSEVEVKVKKPFPIDQDKAVKFRSDFKTWEDYNKYEGSKG